MKRPSPHVFSTLAAALCLVLAPPTVGAPAPGGKPPLPFPVVPLDKLAEQRGGFVGAEGMRLQLSLNLRQLVYVNKQLVSDVRSNVGDMMQKLTGDMNALRRQLQEDRDTLRTDLAKLQTSLDDAGQAAGGVDAKVTGSLSGGIGEPAVSPSSGNMTSETSPGSVSNARPSTTTTLRSENQARSDTLGDDAARHGTGASGNKEVQSPLVTVISPGAAAPKEAVGALDKVVVVQNGPGNHVDTNALRDIRGGTMTIIQNSLNNQSIWHVMEVDVTLSGLRNLRTLTLLGGLNQQLRGAGR